MKQGFWTKLHKPIIGLSPMDGVTDEPFRFITKKYGNPDVIFTEFSNVEGIVRGSIKLLESYTYNESERPIISQVFGKEPNSFYLVSILLCFLGFDGIDINMGCPSKSVSGHGSGAGLIQTPKLAQEIIASCKRGVSDWINGIEITSLPLPKKVIDHVLLMQKSHPNTQRGYVPVSVKTRLGYDKSIINTWIPYLLEAKPVAVSLHGRTLKQMYKGKADWEQIAKAAEIIHKTETLILGNGDVKTRQEAEEKAKKYNVDGILIGRASLGNPWVFKRIEKEISKEEELKIALEHTKYFVRIKEEGRLFEMRKHWGAYIKGFDGARKLRIKLMGVSSFSEASKLLKS